MVLDGLRNKLNDFLDPLVRLFIRVDPNHMSIVSLLFAIAAGFLYAFSDRVALTAGDVTVPFLLILGLLMVILNGIADSLDGRIARVTGRTTDMGDYLDHSFDRLSDIAILTGISFSGYCDTTFGLLAVVSVLLSSYMGTQSQAVGVGRDYSGVMGRADRMVLLFVTTFLQFMVEIIWGVRGWDPLGIGHETSLLEMLMAVMLVGGIFTTLQRGYQAIKQLSERDRIGGPKERTKPGASGRDRGGGQRTYTKTPEQGKRRKVSIEGQKTGKF